MKYNYIKRFLGLGALLLTFSFLFQENRQLPIVETPDYHSNIDISDFDCTVVPQGGTIDFLVTARLYVGQSQCDAGLVVNNRNYSFDINMGGMGNVTWSDVDVSGVVTTQSGGTVTMVNPGDADSDTGLSGDPMLMACPSVANVGIDGSGNPCTTCTPLSEGYCTLCVINPDGVQADWTFAVSFPVPSNQAVGMYTISGTEVYDDYFGDFPVNVGLTLTYPGTGQLPRMVEVVAAAEAGTTTDPAPVASGTDVSVSLSATAPSAPCTGTWTSTGGATFDDATSPTAMATFSSVAAASTETLTWTVCCDADPSCCFTDETTVNLALPVNLLSFEVKKEGRMSHILWATASEISNDYFEVQRSKDGKNFEVIAEVNGQGTSSEKSEYSFVDEKPVNGMNYYRLSQVDFDGKSETFDIRSVKFTATKENVLISPNPFTNAVKLDAVDAQVLSVEIYDVTGRRLHTVSNPDQTLLDLSDMPNGPLMVVVITETGRSIHKLIKE